MADGSSRVEVLVPEGELEDTGGGAETENGILESRRATAQERLIIFQGRCITSEYRLQTLYAENEALSHWGPQLTQSYVSF